MKNRYAMTLVEIIIAALVGSLLLSAAFSLLSSWLKSSVKGASHLSNIQVAVLLSNQIEHDLQRAVSVDMSENCFQIKSIEDVGGAKGEEDITYEETASGEGLKRMVVANGKIVLDRILGDGFRVNKINGEQILQKIAFQGGKFGVKLQFEVASLKNEEACTVNKLVFCLNANENALIEDWVK
ncbi:MAG: hypothetical protein KKB51_05200 [Candidatus Riflebacteria bacterium]|nr:hypothetical protein [Candidatus Riflebacteria bacterium]